MRLLLVALLMLSVMPVTAQGDAAVVEDRPFALERLPVNEETSRRLAGRLMLEQGEFTLVQVAELLEREVGVAVRFDWEGLEKIGVTPESSITFEQGEDEAQRMLSMVLYLVAPDEGQNYPTYMLRDGVVVIGTSRSLVRLAPQVNWPQREQARRPATADRQAELELSRVVTVDFEEAAVGSVIDYIRDTTGANIEVNWPAVEAVEIFEDALVTCVLHRVHARQLLETVLDEVSAENFGDDKLAYTFVEGIVYISTLADIKTRVNVGLYDVRDLVDRPYGPMLEAIYAEDAFALDLLKRYDLAWRIRVTELPPHF